MTNPVVRQFTKHKLLQAYPEEIIFQMRLAKEYIFHVGAEPRDGFLLQGDLPTPDMLSRGSGPYGGPYNLVPGTGIDPEASLGVRLWPSCQRTSVDDIYGEPLEGKFDFKAPVVTMGHLEFNEDSDKEVSVNEFGQVFQRNARMWIPVIHHLENGYSYPKEGDIVEFWARSWHELGVFYDVIKVARDGFINNSNYWVQWVLEIRRNDAFLPERRLLTPEGFTPVDAPVPVAPTPDGETQPAVFFAQEAFCITDPGQSTFVLQNIPIEKSEDVHWNGFHLIPGAGFNGFSPDAFGYVIDGRQLILSSNIDLAIDEIVTIEYQYRSV